MGKKTPGKYKKKGSCKRLAVRSQRLRRARERKEKERFEKRNLDTREDDNATFPGMFNSHSMRATLKRTGKLTVARLFKKRSANAIMGKELRICNISTNSSITVPLRRIGRRTIARISNKLPANALLGTDTAMCHISNIPPLSVPPGRSGVVTVCLKKPFVNPLLGRELIAKNSLRKVFHNPLRCEVISRKRETIVYDRSATVMLSKNLTVPKVSDYTSLGALLCRRGSMVDACVISKPSTSLETTLNPHVNPSSARSENVTDSSLLIEPSLSAPIENVTDSLVVNGPPTIASFENVTAFNACNKPSVSVPLLKTENVTDEDDSNKLYVSASLDRCENVTDASVINKHSLNAPLESATADTYNKPFQKEPSIKSENVTLPDCSSPALPLDENDSMTVAGVPSSEKDLPQDPKHGGQDSRPKEKDEGSVEPPMITSDKKFNKELAAKHKTPETIDLNLVLPLKTTICADATNTAEELLDIEQYHVASENKFPGGRFICDLRSVIRQAREIEAHTATCHFGGKLTYYRTTREGLVHTFYYSCSSPKCGESAKLVTDGHGHSLNRLAVMGAVSNGSGFAQEEKKFRTMNVKYMNKNKFAEYDQSSPDGKLAKCANKATMTDAVNADSQMPVLLQPKIEMDFCVDENWLA